MKPHILLLIIATFAISCNSQVKNDTKHNGIIFKNWILDLDDLKILPENSTNKLNIVWNINDEKVENNVIKPNSTVIIKDNDEREFEIRIVEILAKEADKNYAVVLKNKETGVLAWTYSDFPACCFGYTILLIVAGNKIIIATHSPIATGSFLLCLDIYSGKEIWQGDVKRLPVMHSKYSNSVYLKSFDNKIIIAGDESGGNYIQVIDINTGANLFTKMEKMYNNKIETISKQLICKGEFVNVFVEKAIFHSSKNNNFLMKFEIKNISNKTIGVDLTDYWEVIYPNQWGIYKKPYRDIIDERRVIPDTIIDKIDLINKYNNQTLTFIKPDETIAYYRDWNGSGQKIELPDKNNFLIISIDGQLLLTDGKATEQITICDNEKNRAVVFNYPLVNKTIPVNALIINKGL